MTEIEELKKDVQAQIDSATDPLVLNQARTLMSVLILQEQLIDIDTRLQFLEYKLQPTVKKERVN